MSTISSEFNFEPLIISFSLSKHTATWSTFFILLKPLHKNHLNNVFEHVVQVIPLTENTFCSIYFINKYDNNKNTSYVNMYYVTLSISFINLYIIKEK